MLTILSAPEFLLLFCLIAYYLCTKRRIGSGNSPESMLLPLPVPPPLKNPMPPLLQCLPPIDGIQRKPVTINPHKLGNLTRSSQPRLSKPVPTMKSEYDVVVIGSGYGGSIAASRMARSGKNVCVLERGCEKWPGEYPNKLKDCASEFHVSGHVPTEGSEDGKTGIWNSAGGKPTGMYHLTKGEGQDVLAANGLGGTSLINANVFLRADRRALALSEWPVEIRCNPAELDKCKCSLTPDSIRCI
jgi:hypothetical protein